MTKRPKPNRAESRSIEGYNDLYESFAEQWHHDSLWYVGIITIAWGITWIVARYSEDFSGGVELVASVIALVLTSLLVGFVWLVFFLTFSVSVNPMKEIPSFAVILMVISPQPYGHPQTGLSHKHIEHLKRIAVAERDAADWRGSFVNFAIIGTISAMIWGGPFLWQILVPSTEVEQATTEIMGNPPTYFDLTPAWLDAAMTFIGVLALLWMLMVLLNYFRRFLSGEAANRVIIKACEEAMAFLELKNLADHTSFTFLEKQAIAAHFGCKIVRSDKATLGDKLWYKGRETDGTKWFLVPPPRNSHIQNLRIKSRGAMMWLRSKRFRNPHQ